MLVALLILSSLLIAFGLIALRMGSSSSFLPAVEGVIVESKVVEVVKRGSIQESPTHRRWERLFQPVIVYEYLYNGSHLTSSSLSVNAGEWQSFYGSRAKAESLAAKYPLGAKVAVYRKRSGPEFTVLELGIPRAVKTSLLLGVIVLFAAAFLHFVAGAA